MSFQLLLESVRKSNLNSGGMLGNKSEFCRSKLGSKRREQFSLISFKQRSGVFSSVQLVEVIIESNLIYIGRGPFVHGGLFCPGGQLLPHRIITDNSCMKCFNDIAGKFVPSRIGSCTG